MVGKRPVKLRYGMIFIGFLRDLNCRIIFFLALTFTDLLFVASLKAQEFTPIDIGDRRELFLDDLMIDRLKGDAERLFHRPVPREIVMSFDDTVAGNSWGYATSIRDGDIYRMWYRTWLTWIDEKGKIEDNNYLRICYAESRDGIHWTFPILGIYEFKGSKENNIVWMGEGVRSWVPFRDENPGCPPEALYKALGYEVEPGEWALAARYLLAFRSPDGIHWEKVRDEPVLSDGKFDSQNVAFWDPNIRAYRAYYRDSQSAFGDGDNSGRGIKTSISPDFLTWPEQGDFLNYNTIPPAQFYTNVILPYYRAPHIYIGLPGMYDERGWTDMMEQLPNPQERREWYEAIGRYLKGPLGCETWLMWSRDGGSFDLAPTGFLRAGPERPGSWWYGDAWVAWTMIETESYLEGAAPELSFYVKEKTGTYNLNDRVRRYTMRLDGFASIHAPVRGGEIITKPLIFSGSQLSMNYETSAFGSIRVELQDTEGNPIPGYTLGESVELYSDTVDRSVRWSGGPDLGALSGKPVRLRFVMRDADIYSFRFE